MDAGSLLTMALGGIVGNASSDGVRRVMRQLWQTIRNRLLQNQPAIKVEMVELEQNPTQENLNPLEPFLQVEMHKDKAFTEEISRLGREIKSAQANGDNIINQGNIEAEGSGVAANNINAPNSRFGGSNMIINLGK